MSAAGLPELEAALRGAVARGAHAEAQAKVQQYCTAVDRALRSPGAGDSSSLELVRQATDLLRWALRTTLAERAQQRLKLSMLSSASRYQNPALRPSTLRVSA